jgi:HPt (histidine-containing phosphotransfer) domain-containing protein
MELTREDRIRSRLDDIAGPDPGDAERALLARLLHSFTAKTPARVDRLGELLRDGDKEALRDHAHGLKGSASNIGAEALAAMFAEVEHAAREGVVPDPDETLSRIRAEQEVVLGSVARVADEQTAKPAGLDV